MDLLIKYADMDPGSEEWEIATAARSSECAAIARVFRRWGWAIVVLGVIGFAGAAWIVVGLDSDSEVPPIIVWMWPFAVLVAGVTVVASSLFMRRRSERYGHAAVKDTDLDSSSEAWEIETGQRQDECTELSTVFQRWGYGIAILGAIGLVCATLLLGRWGTDEESDTAPMLISALVSVPMFAGATMVALDTYLGFRSELHLRRMNKESLRRLKMF